MPLVTASQFPLAFEAWSNPSATDKLGTPGKEGDLEFLKLTKSIDSTQLVLGLAGSTDKTSHDYRIAKGTRPCVNVTGWGVLRSTDAGYVSPGLNAINFALMVAQYPAGADFFFPVGNYPTTGFTLYNDGQRIIGCGGAAADGTWDGSRGTVIRKYDAPGGPSPTILIAGTDNTAGGGYGTRVNGAAVEGVLLYNSGSDLNIGIKTKYVTHAILTDVYIIGFRANGGALYIQNTADSQYWDLGIEFCGSRDGTNKAAILVTGQPDAGESSYWAGDELRFMNMRMEVCGDRHIHLANVNFSVPKIRFLACKFENSGNDTNGMNGTNDANQSTFQLDSSQFVLFHGCDFTLQDRQAAFVLPTMFRTSGTSFLTISDSEFQFGSGSRPKVFDRFVTMDGGNSLLTLSNVWVNSGNSGSFPTTVLKGTNTPRLAQKCVGFTPTQGGSKVATDWYTAAEWQSGGVIA